MPANANVSDSGVTGNTINNTSISARGGGDTAGADDSSDTLGIDTKKELLYRIHLKNKYIKRLLCEHSALIETTTRQRNEILTLNVSLKQSAHRLAETLAALLEQKQLNRSSAEDIERLHKKIADIKRQMARIEQDKRQYKNDIECLGEEIQKKIKHWNRMLQSKYENINELDATKVAKESDQSAAIPNESNGDVDRLEIEALSDAVQKRNAIIAEMEVLLTNLTNEIGSSAVIINRIVQNLSRKEHNLAENLEKLHQHLERIVSEMPHDERRKCRKSKAKSSKKNESDDQKKKGAAAKSERKKSEKK